MELGTYGIPSYFNQEYEKRNWCEEAKNLCGKLCLRIGRETGENV